MTAYMKNGTRIGGDTGREIYNALNAYLGKKDDRPGDKQSIRIRRGWKDETIIIRLHATDVVTYHPNGAAVLQWRGWYTQITNAAINAYLPRGFHVSGLRDTTLATYGRGDDRIYRVHDGITIGARGGVSGYAAKWNTAADYDREARRVRNAEARARRARDKARAAEETQRRRIQALSEAFRGMLDDTLANAELWTRIDGGTRAAAIEHAERENAAVNAARREAEREAARAAAFLDSMADAGAGGRFAWKYLQTRGGVIISDHDSSPWTVGEWRNETVTRPCVGLNASDRRHDAFRFVRGGILAVVEIRGKYHDGRDKLTCESMRVIAAWNVAGDMAGSVYKENLGTPFIVSADYAGKRIPLT
jgi:hypothetical protein